MSNSTTPMSRRQILIGGAAVVGVTGLSITTFASQPSLRVLSLRREKIKEKLR